jgi:hypothetical protein
MFHSSLIQKLVHRKQLYRSCASAYPNDHLLLYHPPYEQRLGNKGSGDMDLLLTAMMQITDLVLPARIILEELKDGKQEGRENDRVQRKG